MSKFSIQRARSEMQECISCLGPNVFLTFNFNPPRVRYAADMKALSANWGINPDNAKVKIKNFFNATQRRVYGRGWFRQKDRRWPEAYGFLENAKSNFHYHVVARVDDAFESELVTEGPGRWKKLCPGGQLDVRPIYDVEVISRYVTKKFYSLAALDAMFAYSDPRK